MVSVISRQGGVDGAKVDGANSPASRQWIVITRLSKQTNSEMPQPGLSGGTEMRPDWAQTPRLSL